MQAKLVFILFSLFMVTNSTFANLKTTNATSLRVICDGGGQHYIDEVINTADLPYLSRKEFFLKFSKELVNVDNKSFTLNILFNTWNYHGQVDLSLYDTNEKEYIVITDTMMWDQQFEIGMDYRGKYIYCEAGPADQE